MQRAEEGRKLGRRGEWKGGCYVVVSSLSTEVSKAKLGAMGRSVP